MVLGILFVQLLPTYNPSTTSSPSDLTGKASPESDPTARPTETVTQPQAAASISAESSTDEIAATEYQTFVKKLGPKVRQSINDLTHPSDEGLVSETLPDGSAKINLQRRYRHVPAAVVNEDGSLTIREFNRPITQAEASTDE